jgi:4-amino-4-deoxy-L-arabinose transferase-like glycosyltransferase
MTCRAKLAVIVAVAALLRLAFVLGYPQMPVVDDAAAYDQEARLLASGAGWAAIGKGPVYPAVLAAVYRWISPSAQAVRILQALLGCVTVWLIFRLGSAVWNPRAGLMAAALAAAYPPSISYSGLLLTETVSALLVAAFLLALVRALQQPGARRWLLAGALGGAAILHREDFLVVVIAALAVSGWRARAAWGTALAGAAALLVVLPWTARNAVVHHRFVLVAPTFGQTLWVSAHPDDWQAYRMDDERFRSLVEGRSPAEADRLLRRESLAMIRDHPLSYLQLCLKRIPRFWLGGHSNTIVGFERSTADSLGRGDYGVAAVKLVLLALNTGLILLGLYGARVSLAVGDVPPELVWLLAAPVAAKALVHIFVFASPRYLLPLMPCLLVFAGAALERAWQAFDNVMPLRIDAWRVR